MENHKNKTGKEKFNKRQKSKTQNNYDETDLQPDDSEYLQNLSQENEIMMSEIESLK